MRLLNDSSICLFFIFILTLTISGCIVPNQDLIQLKDDVKELKRENAALRQSRSESSRGIKERLVKVEAALSAIKSDFNENIDSERKEFKKSVADSGVRLDSIRVDFQHLLGRFEEVNHLSEKTSTENLAFMESADNRIKTIEGNIKELEDGLEGMASELSDIKAISAAVKEEKKASALTKESPNKLYKAGLDAIRKGKTGEARKKFKQYLREYPDEPLANNAQFWIGESYYDEKEYERAILEFDDTIKKYPKGGKVPAAMLKQAMAFNQIKEKETAMALFKKLIGLYPDSSEAAKARKIMNKKGKTKK